MQTQDIHNGVINDLKFTPHHEYITNTKCYYKSEH